MIVKLFSLEVGDVFQYEDTKIIAIIKKKTIYINGLIEIIVVRKDGSEYTRITDSIVNYLGKGKIVTTIELI